MPRRIHYHEFETFILKGDETLPVRVEATISASSNYDVEIEGVRVFLDGDDTELALSDHQYNDIYAQVFEEFEIPEPGDDWRNNWE